jgi:hypothetical protein
MSLRLYYGGVVRGNKSLDRETTWSPGAGASGNNGFCRSAQNMPTTYDTLETEREICPWSDDFTVSLV